VTSIEAQPAELASNDIMAFLRGYELSLRARNRSPKTIASYVLTVNLFHDYLVGVGSPRITRCSSVSHEPTGMLR
jgi:hypothetical protein